MESKDQHPGRSFSGRVHMYSIFVVTYSASGAAEHYCATEYWMTVKCTASASFKTSIKDAHKFAIENRIWRMNTDFGSVIVPHGSM